MTVTGELVHFVNANNNAYEFKQDSVIVSYEAPAAPELTVAGKSWDWLALSGSFLTTAGHVEDFIVENPIVAYKFSTNTAGNIIGGLGWAQFADGVEIAGFGYTIDGGALVTEPI
ncbi:MAG: hypothetical protein J6Z80_02900, partial [Clostridia bacterium]|nr:hypothetical protein [Clostridia bacterium]